MKKIKYAQHMFLVLIITVLTGCPKDELSPQDEQLIALKNNGKAWVLAANGVDKDGYDVTDQFTGFKLSIGDYTYSTQNSLITAWAASGTWEFNGENLNSVLRDDGVVISLTNSEASLTISFAVSAPTGGRVESLTGDYTFYLKSE